MSGELVSDGVDGIRTTRLLARAVRERWPIPEEKRAAITNRIIQDVEEGKTARARVAAYKAVVAADKLNKDDTPKEPQQHLHLHQHQEQAVNLDDATDEELARLEAMLNDIEHRRAKSGARSAENQA